MFDGLKDVPPAARVLDAIIGTIARALVAGELPRTTESLLVETRIEEDEAVVAVVEPASSKAWITRIPGRRARGVPPTRGVLRLSEVAPILALYGASVIKLTSPAAGLPLTPIEPSWSLDEIYLSKELRQRLAAFIAIAERRPQALAAAGELSRGVRAVTALMVGPPGVGKSICAEAIAHGLHRPLVRVRASDIESKYAGETQKNIKGIFEYAQAHGVVLFFDEAESLISRLRGMVTAQDKYANSVRAEILLSLDAHDGCVLFASNWGRFDTAFLRRCLFAFHFEQPTLEDLRGFLASMQKKQVINFEKESGLDALAERLAQSRASFSTARTALLRATLRAFASGESVTLDLVAEELGALAKFHTMAEE